MLRRPNTKSSKYPRPSSPPYASLVAASSKWMKLAAMPTSKSVMNVLGKRQVKRYVRDRPRSSRKCPAACRISGMKSSRLISMCDAEKQGCWLVYTNNVPRSSPTKNTRPSPGVCCFTAYCRFPTAFLGPSSSPPWL